MHFSVVIVLLLAVVIGAAGRVAAACPSVAACHRFDVPCNTSATELDSNLSGPFWPVIVLNASCHVVNCTGQAAALRGEIPCDLPSNTTFLLLANIGMAGNFSFQTLQERAPSVFYMMGDKPAWTGIVDVSGNNLAALEMVPSTFWDMYSLNAHLDLSGNNITTVQSSLFQSAQIFGALDLSGNDISVIPSGAFQNATVYSYLDLSYNSIVELQPYAFQSVELHGKFYLCCNRLTTIQSGVFQDAQVHYDVDLSFNNLTSIAPDAFTNAAIHGNVSLRSNNMAAVPALPVIGGLDLSNNSITTVQTSDLSTIGSGGYLSLSFNKFTTVPPFAFQGAVLSSLDLSNNQITTVPSFAFNSAEILELDLRGNRITMVQQRAFYGAMINDLLSLNGNRIAIVQSFAFDHGYIRALNLHGNDLSELSDLSFAAASFANLDLSNNNISRIAGGWYNEFNSTGSAFFDASMAELNLANNRLTALYAQTFAGMRINAAANFAHNNISILQEGWSSAFPLEIMLSMTGNPSRCAVGRLANTLRTFVCACANDSRLDILGNGAYCSRASCTTPDNIFVANGTFNCSDRTHASGSTCNVVCNNGYDYLDASFTSITCLGGVWGKRPNLAATYPVCVQRACSAIPHEAVANGHFECNSTTSTSGFPLNTNCTLVCDAGYEPLSGRTATCLLSPADNGVWGVLPNLTYRFPVCAPTRGVTKLQTALIALGSSVGSLLIAGVIYLLANYRQRIRRQEYDLELKEHLLSEQGEELDALRQVFTIPADEVRLEARIDSGAFGEVWRGRWNDMAVAVKRMQAVLLAFDSSFALEFEAETTLMRRLRHTNVVTFFGAGTDRDGMPFLVCELMANSLQKLVWVPDLLRGQQKVKWARDAAQGMAFLHAKGVIHRDLKSGNLLGKK